MRALYIGSGATPPPFIDIQLSFMHNNGCVVLRPFDNRSKSRVLKDAVIDIFFNTHQSIKLFRFSKHTSGTFKDRVRWFLKNSVIVRYKSIDIIHFQWPAHAIKYRWLLDWYRSVPSVLSLRGRQVNYLPFIQDNKIYINELSTIIKRVDMLHIVSSMMVSNVKKICSDIDDKYFIAASGVDTEYFCQGNDIEYNPLRIVSVGALIWRKGHIYLIKAAHRLIDQGYNIRLKIVGEGPYRDLLQGYIDSYKLGDHIKLLGYRDREFIKRTYKDSGIFILPSLSEGLCNSLAEAMSMMLPVIVTSCESSEAVEDSANGFIIPKRDAKAISDKILFFIKNKERIFEFGKKSRDIATSRYCYFNNNKETLRYYNAIINKQKV